MHPDMQQDMNQQLSQDRYISTQSGSELIVDIRNENQVDQIRRAQENHHQKQMVQDHPRQ